MDLRSNEHRWLETKKMRSIYAFMFTQNSLAFETWLLLYVPNLLVCPVVSILDCWSAVQISKFWICSPGKAIL